MIEKEKAYTVKDYSNMAIQANNEGKKLVKIQEEIEYPQEVLEWFYIDKEVERQKIDAEGNPMYDEDGKPIMETVTIQERKAKMIKEAIINPETGAEETQLVQAHHTETFTKAIERLKIVDYSNEEKRTMLNKKSLTKREVFLALYKDKGITPEQLRGSITDEEALIEFDYAERFYRGNPLIDAIGIQLGYSIEDLDHLFEYKELPINEN